MPAMRQAPDDGAGQPLRLLLPGAFAGLGAELRRTFAAVSPDAELDFHAFVPSGMLAREILDGAPADVFVSANTQYMEELRQAGLIKDARILAGNRLCIIVRPDRAATIRGLDDLVQPGIHVVTPQHATDPCGQYVIELFARAGLSELMTEKEALGELVHSRGSGDLPAYLHDGRVEAGIFYASEAQALAESVVRIDLPSDLDLRDRIVFTIGVVERNRTVHPLAARFVAFCVGPAGQDLLESHGFARAGAVVPGSIASR